MGIDLLGPLRLAFVIILMVVIFGPAIWLINKAMEKSGADTNKNSTTVWTLILGIFLTFVVALFGRGQGWWGQ
jgi:hypothetical protein